MPIEKAILFSGLLYSDRTIYEKTRQILETKLGEILLESDERDWTHSDYYREELGWPIKRRFLMFYNQINPEHISEIKLITIEIEKELSIESKRKINIDPGYLTLAKIVLVTTKNYAHRIYLKNGIYAEITLIYKSGTYQPHLFTYPDFRNLETIEFLLKGRQILKNGVHY